MSPDDRPTESTLESPGRLEPGTRIGPYKLLRQLGEGGMGVVYLAEQTEPVRRQVALKLVKVGLDTKQFVARFEAERQALAVMNHPNIAKVFDAGATDAGRPYFVMELARGVPITTYCDRYNLPTKDRLGLFIQVCEAIQHAHQKGVIHRDLKPSNVIVTMEDQRPIPKVIDFGLAKAVDCRLTEQTIVTGVGFPMGTLAYMSPEQAEASELDVDTRTDVYSLGVTLYELLVGTLPCDPMEMGQRAFLAEHLLSTKQPPPPSARLSGLGDHMRKVAAHRSSEPKALKKQLKGDLDRIAMKAIEHDRARRYGTATGLALDIQRFMNDEPVRARPASAPYRIGKFIRRHKVGVAAAALVVLSLVSGMLLATLGLVRARRAESVAAGEAAAAREVSDFLVGLFEVSDPNEARSDSITAREILDKGAERITHELGDQPITQARFMNAIGRVFMALGLYDRALPILERSLELRVAEHGEAHPEVAASLDELALLSSRQGKYETAVALFERAVSIWEQDSPGYDSRLALSLDGLGSTLRRQGKLVEAEGRYRQALTLNERTLGPNHPNVARNLSNLATLYRRQGNLDEAAPMYERALKIREDALGPNHPYVARTLNSFAILRILQERFTEAEELLLRSLEIKEAVYGPDHPDVGNNLENLAILYARQEKWAEAEEMFKRVLASRERVLGSDHPDIAQVLNNLGVLCQESGKQVEAEVYFRRSIGIAENALGPNHPNLADTLMNLAVLLSEQGREDEAQVLAARADEIRGDD